VVDGDKYKFKPVLNVNDRKGLLKLLSNSDAQGLGGVLVEEVEESVPHAAKALRVSIRMLETLVVIIELIIVSGRR